MTKTELIAEFREVVDDKVAPYAWSDTRITRLLAQAENRFCLDTGFFVDMSTAAICSLTLTTAQSYTLDSRIINVLEVWYGSTLLRPFTNDDRPKSGTIVTDTQAPKNYQLDREPGKITFLETVLPGTVLTMRVWRRPVTPLTGAATSPEIPEDFHLALVEHAAWKALSDHDRELQDPVKAADHFAAYKRYAVEGREAFDLLSNSFHRVSPATQYVV